MKQFRATDYYLRFMDEFYLDEQQQVRRKTPGYHGRFQQDELAKFFERSDGYWYFQMPRIRTTMKRAQLVYSLAYGQIPEGMDIDHVDGDRSNDHPNNLRLVSRALNNKNRRKRSDNTSGVTGIRWSDYHQHYVVRRTVHGVRKSTSRKTLEEAIQALHHLTELDTQYTDRHGM